MTAVTNVLPLAQRLAEVRRAARALIDGTPTDLGAGVAAIRRAYYRESPDERDRLLWRRFALAEQTHADLAGAFAAVRERLDAERPWRHATRIYAINFAIPNAAAAASPPTSAVCHALRSGFLTVKVPLT
jgi:hypothetical protein